MGRPHPQSLTGMGECPEIWGDDASSVAIGQLNFRVGITDGMGFAVGWNQRRWSILKFRRDGGCWPDGLGDIANLGERAREGGLTLAEGKRLLAAVQRGVVAAQADGHATL